MFPARWFLPSSSACLTGPCTSIFNPVRAESANRLAEIRNVQRAGSQRRLLQRSSFKREHLWTRLRLLPLSRWGFVLTGGQLTLGLHKGRPWPLRTPQSLKHNTPPCQGQAVSTFFCSLCFIQRQKLCVLNWFWIRSQHQVLRSSVLLCFCKIYLHMSGLKSDPFSISLQQ